jgi:hypothetical protein
MPFQLRSRCKILGVPPIVNELFAQPPEKTIGL